MVVRRWRWKNRTRTVVLIVAVVLVTAMVAFRAPARPVGAQEPVHYVTLTVMPGDTIWTLAAPYVPAHDDIRRYVDAVISLNGLSGSLIRPGQQLRVPVYSSSGF